MGPHICTLILVLMVNIRTYHNEKVLREMEYTKKYEKKGNFAVKGMEIQWGLFTLLEYNIKTIIRAHQAVK